MRAGASLVTQCLRGTAAGRAGRAPSRRSVDSPVYVLGNAINALHLDRMDDDLDRLGLVNDVSWRRASAPSARASSRGSYVLFALFDAEPSAPRNAIPASRGR
jgi:hypothetical protein